MNERAPTRPAWLEWLTTAIPPVSLIVALLVYFAWVRRIAQSASLGLDASILEEPSVPGYLARSVGSLFVPLVVLTLAALVLLELDRRLRAWVDDRRKLRLLLRIAIGVPTAVIALLVIVGIAALTGPVVAAYASLAAPFLLATGVLAINYGNSLRRSVRRRLPTRRSRSLDERGLASTLLSGFLVALLLFAGVDGFAKVVGRGLAQQVIDHPYENTRPVQLYSRDDLQLDAADAVHTELAIQGDQGFRHRYDGLRLAFVDGNSYFLIPRSWERARGKIIVLGRDDTRIEFIR